MPARTIRCPGFHLNPSEEILVFGPGGIGCLWSRSGTGEGVAFAACAPRNPVYKTYRRVVSGECSGASPAYRTRSRPRTCAACSGARLVHDKAPEYRHKAYCRRGELSTGETVTDPRHERCDRDRIRRWQKDLSRKTEDSENWDEDQVELAMAHARIADDR